MPRKDGNKKRSYSLSDYEEMHEHLGRICALIMSEGAYVGLWYNLTDGINIRIKWENDQGDFYAGNALELAIVEEEVRQWLTELNQRPPTGKRRKS